MFFIVRRCKKLRNRGRRPFMPDFLVVRTVSQQKLLVVPQERRFRGVAFVPDQDAPSSGLQDAHELRPRTIANEPVRRLRRGYETCLSTATGGYRLLAGLRWARGRIRNSRFRAVAA